MSPTVPSLFRKTLLTYRSHNLFVFFFSLLWQRVASRRQHQPDMKYSTRGDLHSFIFKWRLLTACVWLSSFRARKSKWAESMSRMSRVESSIIFESHELNHELNDLNRMNRIHQIKTISRQSHASNTRPDPQSK